MVLATEDAFTSLLELSVGLWIHSIRIVVMNSSMITNFLRKAQKMRSKLFERVLIKFKLFGDKIGIWIRDPNRKNTSRWIKICPYKYTLSLKVLISRKSKKENTLILLRVFFSRSRESREKNSSSLCEKTYKKFHIQVKLKSDSLYWFFNLILSVELLYK